MLNNILLATILLFCPTHSSLDIVVRPTDLDSKGHVNNARYVEYLQWGRWDWLKKHGVVEDGFIFVVVHLEIDYKSEVHYGDTLLVETYVSQEGEKKIIFNQKMYNGNTVAIEAKSIILAIDPTTRKSIPVPVHIWQRVN